MQHFLKAFCTAAWARVVPSEFLEQILISMHYSVALLDVRLGWVSAATLAHGLVFKRTLPRGYA